ncbi:MAG: L-seryl-tRNA(Sec) selenium transferase [Planctomycetota bacterium]
MDTPPPDDGTQRLLRSLPSVDALLNQPGIAGLIADYPRGEVVRAVRAVLDECRAALRCGRPVAVDGPSVALEIRRWLYERTHPNLRKVINATGIVLHTGLGRAPLAAEAIGSIAETAAGYCNLELDLASGRRGSRHDHVRDLLRELCGAEDALAVNNNAAATYLALHALAAGREVLIARGQLVEIGGEFRLPDIMAAAGCRMVEVGTTNRTRITDFERAVTDQTAALLRVHTSNFRVVGFTQSVPLDELVALGRRHNLPVIDDLGSGLLFDDAPFLKPGAGSSSREEAAGPVGEEEGMDAQGHGSGAVEAPPAGDLSTAPSREDDAIAENATRPQPVGPMLAPDEPSVAASLAAGADLALFSGDKLLGGPQAGVIVGRAELVARLRQDPLARALRPDKLTLAALEATLRLYRDPATLADRLPAWRLLTRAPEELRAAAERLAELIRQHVPDADLRVHADWTEAGGGSLAAVPFPTWVVELRTGGAPAEGVAEQLRRRELPIIGRIHAGALVFDVRTLAAEDEEQIAAALAEVTA